MKKLFKLFSLVQAARSGHGAWKGGRKHQSYGRPGGSAYGYGQRRSRGGLKGMLVEAVMSRLFRR